MLCQNWFREKLQTALHFLPISAPQQSKKYSLNSPQCCIMTGSREVTLSRVNCWVKELGSFPRSQGSFKYEKSRGELAYCLLFQHKSLCPVSECLLNITQLNNRPGAAGKIRPLKWNPGMNTSSFPEYIFNCLERDFLLDCYSFYYDTWRHSQRTLI